jgi:hypothetical protein
LGLAPKAQATNRWGPGAGRAHAYLGIRIVGPRSDGRDQTPGSTDTGGAAPAHGGDVSGVGAGACSRGYEVTGVSQDRREGPDKLIGGTLATRPGPETRERQRECSGQVGLIPARNPGHGVGQSGVLRLGLALAKEGEHHGPQRVLGMGPI